MRNLEVEKKILELGNDLLVPQFKIKGLLKGGYQIPTELLEEYNAIAKEQGDLQRNLGY